MKTQDRKNLIRGMPIYLLCIVLLAGLAILYHQNLSKHGNEPLQDSIAKNLKKLEDPFNSVDDVINNRKSWEPILFDWKGKILPNLTFNSITDGKQQLSDFQGKQIILVIGATWFPPFKIQLDELLGLTGKEHENLIVIALCVESIEKITAFGKNKSYPFILGSVDYLPEPYSLPNGFPCIFIIDPERRLKLAAIGLIPLSHLNAILQLALPEN